MLKETKSISSLGIFDQILILAQWETGQPIEEVLQADISVRRLKNRFFNGRGNLLKKVVKHLEWMARVLYVLLKSPCACINCHSISVLVLCVFAKQWHRCKLVYDTHELETETVSMFGLKQKLARFIERKMMPYVDELVVVSPSIAAHYQATYGKQPRLIRNLPSVKQAERGGAVGVDLRKLLNLTEQETIFLYQGLLARGRGVELLLETFQHVSPEKHLVFLGFGVLESKIREISAQHSNIHLLPAVPPAQLLAWTEQADVGVCFIEDVCLSYRFALPNKLFEYIVSGVPVLASRLPDMSAVLEKYQCGWTVDSSTVLERVQSLDRSTILHCRKGCELAADSLVWETQLEEFQAIYSTAPARSTLRAA